MAIVMFFPDAHTNTDDPPGTLKVTYITRLTQDRRHPIPQNIVQKCLSVFAIILCCFRMRACS